jgi:hypothetical protein
MSAYRYIVFSFSVIGIIIWTIWLIKNKTHWGYSVAPMSYLLHNALLYLFVIFGSLTPTQINNWSNAVRLHGMFLLIGLGITLLICEKSIWTRPS